MSLYRNVSRLNNTGDILELLGNARSTGTRKVLIHSSDLNRDFFNLRSGVAGEFLQKFINYSIEVAILLSSEDIKDNPRFQEMVGESNSIGSIGYFTQESMAKSWLLSL